MPLVRAPSILHLVAVAATLLWTAAATADGGMVVSSTTSETQAEAVAAGLVSSSGQRAVLWLREGGLDLIIDPGTVGIEDAAWVLPLPVVPDISEVSPGFLDELDAATLPIFQTETTEASEDRPSLGCEEMGKGAGGDGVFESDTLDEDVYVWDSGRLGSLEYELVSTEESAALQDWLDIHGYMVPEDTEDAIAPYVADGFCFFVARVVRQPQDPRRVPVVKFALEDVSAPWYPLRLSRWSVADELAFTLWLVYPVDDPDYVPEDCVVREVGYSFYDHSPPPGDMPDLPAAYEERLDVIFGQNDGRALAVQFSGAFIENSDILSRLNIVADAGVELPEAVLQGDFSSELRELYYEPYRLARLTGRFPVDQMDRDLVFVPGDLPYESGWYERYVFEPEDPASCTTAAGDASRGGAVEIRALLILLALGTGIALHRRRA